MVHYQQQLTNTANFAFTVTFHNIFNVWGFHWHKAYSPAWRQCWMSLKQQNVCFQVIRCCMDTNFKEPSTPRSHVSYYKFIVEYWFHYCLLSVHSSPPSSSLGTSVSVWTKLALRWLCGPSWLRLSSCLMIFETWPTVRGPYCRTNWLLPSTRTPWVSREDACCRFSSHISDIVLFTVNKQGLTYTTVH